MRVLAHFLREPFRRGKSDSARLGPIYRSLIVETIPIPKINAAEQGPFIRLVDRILEAKADNPSADTSEQEGEIDQLVYQRYDLTAEEIATVENNHD